MVAELERLASVINGRTVGFIGHGPSLSEFDRWVRRFKNADICWVSLNQVGMAREILAKIGEDIDIILGYAKNYEGAFDNETCYVHRYSLGRGNSLSEFLFQIKDIRCPIILFGCDGYSDGASYYNGVGCANQNARHKKDCDELNAVIHNFSDLNIINTCMTSKYDFKKMEWFNLFRKLGMQRSISILLPTRDRPLLLCHMLLTLDLNTKNKKDVEVLIAHDEDDDLTPHIVSGIRSEISVRAVRCKRRENLHSYYNELLRQSSNKYVMCINDDTEFPTKNWDQIVFDQMPKIGYGWIEDGLLFRECDTKYCCFPVVSREPHDVVGYIQDERWSVGGADINLYYMYEQLGLVKYIKDVRIGHLSWHNGTREKDDINRRIDAYHCDTPFDRFPPVADMEKIKEFLEYYKKSDPNAIHY